ncbi:MAG: SIMPL domain-containing protein [Planctomycetaceae bacterium]|nr:SIMPL domain-containing protein [Planctomycetaceae bacterium]
MILQRCFSVMTTCFAFFIVTMTAWAQYPGFLPMNMSGNTALPYPAISVSGTSTVKSLPGTIRVIIPIQVKAKTIDEAITSLQAGQKTALEKIQKIGFKKEQVEFDNFGFDQLQENKRRQMEAMISQRMNQPGQKKPEIAESVALRCLLIAEWPIVGKTVEEILRESYTLKQKINAADFISKKGTLTPEEEELAEEMESMNDSSGGPESSNDPQLIYIAKISEEEGQKAYTEAFEQARKQGEFLAKAANVKLGTLMQLSAGLTKNQKSLNPYSRDYQDYDYYVMQMVSQQFGGDSSKQLECIATAPGLVEFTFIVQAVFLMEGGK